MKIGAHEITRNGRTFVVAEIGINHSGNVEQACALIRAAHSAGADAVKFQKRTIEIVYTPDERARLRESPFGTTNGDLKWGLELGRDDYDRIDALCHALGIPWFASPWDVESVAFLAQYDLPAMKVASACVTDYELLRAIATVGCDVIMSTGMSTGTEIDRARACFSHCRPLGLLACTASYPAAIEDLHLARIGTLHDRFRHDVIGWSGHEVGVWSSLCAVVLGARIIERHFTLDRSMWGSDQAASLEPHAFAKLVREIRDFETALGTGDLRVLDCEVAVREKLRRVK